MASIRNLLAAVVVVALGAMGVQAHCYLTYPTGGETFNAGDVVNVQWGILIYHGPCDWDLYLSIDNGATWQPIVENLPKTTLDYDWTVPSTATTQAVVRIVQDNVTPPSYDAWSGPMTIVAPERVPSGSPLMWGLLAVILAGIAVFVLRHRLSPAKAKRK